MSDNGLTTRPLALVTGASSGIGFELARCCAEDGHDLLIAADEDLTEASTHLRASGAAVHAVRADLATQYGVERVLAAAAGRPVAMLLANAGHGLGRAFLDQPFDEVRHVIDTNITGTLLLVQQVAREMRLRRQGRILITGSVAGFMPGSFQAVYNGSKAFLDSFALALRNELQGTGVTVTCLLPGPTDTRFFQRADMLDTRLAQQRKAPPDRVARAGYRALKRGQSDVVAGWRNKLRVALATFTPAPLLAQTHRRWAEPLGPRR